jgi:hypothetical protein
MAKIRVQVVDAVTFGGQMAARLSGCARAPKKSQFRGILRIPGIPENSKEFRKDKSLKIVTIVLRKGFDQFVTYFPQ